MAKTKSYAETETCFIFSGIIARLDKIERQMKLDKQKLGAINDKIKTVEKSMAGVVGFLKYFKKRLLKLVK